MAEVERRRRRLRHPTVNPDVNRSQESAEIFDPAPGTGYNPTRGASLSEDREGDRGLRGLVGAGSSQVSLDAALRARDASRPSAADLAEAERRVVLIRRNWTPRNDSPSIGERTI